MALISSGIHTKDHFTRGNQTHAVTTRKQKSIKFSSMEKSVAGFIWAADKKKTNNFLNSFSSLTSLNPLLTLLIRIYLSPSVRTVILDFYL